MIEHALQYAGRGWRVFPVHTVNHGVCSCGKADCKHPGKHPLTRQGVKDATTARDTIKGWWAKWPSANIGIATGSGLIVVDTDSVEQIEQFRDLANRHGGMPETAVSRTGRGAHWWFSGQLDSSRIIDGLLFRGEGGYAIAPPSKHVNGTEYQWVRNVALANAPGWLNDHISKGQQGTGKVTVAEFSLGPPPAHIIQANLELKQALNGQTRMVDQKFAPPYTVEEHQRIIDALSFIPASCDRQTWLQVGMALHSLEWETNAGDVGFEIWNAWSSTCPEKYSAYDCEVVWRSLRRSGINLATLFFIAQQHGWNSVPRAPDPTLPSPNGVLTQFLLPLPVPANPIDELNSQYCVIGDIGGKCLVLGWAPAKFDSHVAVPSFQSFKSFSERYGNRYVNITKPDGTRELKQLGTLWLKHAQRRTYDFIDLRPDAGPIIPPNTLNLWRGFGVEPQPGTWNLMKQHIGATIANGDPKSIQYVLRWAAWAVQHPAERAEVALVLRGGKGTGKGTFAHALRRLFGQHGLHVANSKHLVGSFNAHLRSCLLLFADEAFWAGDKQGESTLKAMLTEPTIPIEQKGVDVIEWTNRLHVIMAANAEWVVPATHDERRYAVFEVSELHRGDRDYWVNLYEEITNGGLSAMLYDLLHSDLGGWHPRYVVETDALADQKQRSMSPLHEWWQEILDNAHIPFCPKDETDISAAIMLINSAREWSSRLRDLNPTQLGRFLSKQGCAKIHKANGNFWRFPPLDQARTRWATMYQRGFSVEANQWRPTS